MNLSKMDGMTVVALSRKNLTELLRGLDLGSRETPQLIRKTETDLLIVLAEENDVHYNSLEREEIVRGESGPGIFGTSEIHNPPSD